MPSYQTAEGECTNIFHPIPHIHHIAQPEPHVWLKKGGRKWKCSLKKEHFPFLSGNNGNSWERTAAGLALYTRAASLRERPCNSSLLRRHWAQHLVQVHLVLVHHVQHLVLVHLVQHSCASTNDLATLLYFGDIEHNVLAHVHQLYALSVVMIHGLCMYYEQCVLKYVLCSVSMCCVPDWQNRLWRKAWWPCQCHAPTTARPTGLPFKSADRTNTKMDQMRDALILGLGEN